MTRDLQTRLQSFFREPAWLIELVEVGLLMLVAFGLGLSGDQQTYIVAAVVALSGLVTAFFTRPFAVAALTDFARAALTVFASFGVGLSADQIALVVTFLGVLTTGVVRGQVTPAYDPVIAPAGAGAGPVRGEAGYAVLGAIGLGLVILTVLLLVATLLKVVAISWVVLIVLFVIGVVLLALDGGWHRRL